MQLRFELFRTENVTFSLGFTSLLFVGVYAIALGHFCLASMTKHVRNAALLTGENDCHTMKTPRICKTILMKMLNPGLGRAV